MGCKNTKGVTLPTVTSMTKTYTVTPQVIRRNLKTEIYKNNGKIRNVEDEIIKHQTELYILRSKDSNSSKLKEVEALITEARGKIFNYQTHNMILELHLETAAPGQYPYKKYDSTKSRNFGLSKASTANSSKQGYGYLQTEASCNGIVSKPSGLTEMENYFRHSLHSIQDEGNVSF